MSGKNKVTFNMIAAEMEEDLNVEVAFAGKNNEIKINVVRRLEFDDAMMFVRDVAAPCTNVAGESFLPEMFDFSVKANTLIYYAGMKAPDDIEKAYSVIYGTNLYDVVRNEIDEEQYMALVSAAKERVNNDKEVINSTHEAKINELIDKMDEVMRDGEQAIGQLSSDDMINTIRELEKMFGGSGSVDDTADAPASGNIVRLHP